MKSLLITVFAVFVLFLAGCQEESAMDKASSKMDDIIDKVDGEGMLEEAAESAEDAMDDAADAVEEFGEDMSDAAKNAKEKVEKKVKDATN